MSAKAIKIQDKIPSQRRCLSKTCKKKFTPARNNQFVCDWKCANDYTNQLNAKKSKAEKAEGYERLKTHSDYCREIDEICQEIARLLDNGCNCISCQKPPKKKNGGHRYSKKAEPQLRHNLLNIFLQCEACNSPEYGNGNPDGYDRGLEMYFGVDLRNEVNNLRIQYPTNKQSISELVSAKARAKKILSELRKLGLTYSDKNRIELRRKFNKQINIYQ